MAEINIDNFIAKRLGQPQPNPTPDDVNAQASGDDSDFDMDIFLSERSGNREPTLLDRVGDLAGGANQALFDVVDLPVTAVNFAQDLMGVSEDYRFDPFTKELRPMFSDRTEIMQGEDNAMQDYGRTFSEWASPALVTKGISKVPEILGGLGAATGEQVGGDTGELVGGMAGLLGPMGFNYTAEAASKGKIAVDNARASGENPLVALGKAAVDPPKTVEPETQATLNFLRGNTSPFEFQQAERSARQGLAEGQEGSLSDLAPSPNMAAVERSAAKEPSTAEALRGSYAARQAQIADEFGQRATPALDTPTQPTARSIEAEGLNRERGLRNRRVEEARGLNQAVRGEAQASRQAAEAEAEAARIEANRADMAMGGSGRTDQSSARLSESYKDLDEYIRKNDVKPAWAKFEEVRDISNDDMAQTLSRFSESIPEVERADLNRKFKGIMNNLNNMGEITDPRDVQYVLSSLKQINREARTTGNFGPLNTRLSEIGNIVDGALRKNEKVKEPFKNAIAATVLQKQRMGGKPVEKALRGDPETFASKLGFKGDQGAATVRGLRQADDPAVAENAESYLRDAIRKEGVSEKTLDDYAAALDEFPELKKDVIRAVDTRQTLDEVQAAGKDTAKAAAQTEKEADSVLKNSINAARKTAQKGSKRVRGLPMSQFSRTPNEFIDKSLDVRKDDSGELGKVYKEFAKKGPEVANAFKSKVLSRLKREILEADEVTPDMQIKLDRLVDNGVLGSDDMSMVGEIIGRQEGRRLRRSAGASGTTQGTQDSLNQAMDDLVSTLGTLPLLSALPSSHQLMAAGMFKRTFKRLLSERRMDPKKLKRLEEMLSKPDVFLRGLEGKITVDTTPAEMQAEFMKLMRRAAVAGQDEEQE